MRKNRAPRAAGAWVLTAWATALPAQTAPTPGTVGDTLKPPPQLPQPPVAPPIEAPRRAAPGAVAAGGKAIAVQRFVFSGNTVFSSEQLEAVVAPYTGRALTLLEIYEAADKVTDHYVAAGYTLASANVPPQKIENGVVRLEVLEGRIGAITLERPGRYDGAQLASYLHGVERGLLYRGSALEQGMARINELPGLQARALLRPGDEFGSTDVVLQTREDFFAGGLSVDNFGRENVGEFRTTASAVLNNPTGVADQLTVMALVSEDALLKYGYVAYSVPVNFRGTRLEISYGEARFEVDDDAFLGVEGDNKSGRIALSHPLLRTRSNRLSATVAISNTDSNADIVAGTFADTQLTLLELGAIYNHAYASRAATQLVAGLATNFEEATTESLFNDLGEPDDQRLRLELDLQHLQPMPGKTLQLIARLNGVWSPDPLADTQQFSIGGPNSVRGYAAADERGDRGYFASLTLRQPFDWGPMKLAGRVFGDTGRVYAAQGGARESLSSLGVGVDAAYQRLSARLDWSFAPDEQDVEDFQKNRLFGSLSMAF